MARVRNVTATKKRHKKYLKAAKGYVGGRRKLYRAARETVHRAWQYSAVHRRLKKRNFRTLWISRITAAAEENGITYSQLMNRLLAAEVLLDRKSISEIAQIDPAAFQELVKIAKAN
jgi:large subunit ribosomal protein L20